jgi:hypothetical protein
MQDGSAEEECTLRLGGKLLDHWRKCHNSYPHHGIPYGTTQEAEACIRTFVECFYRDYFLEKLDGSRARLTHDFESFANGYWVVMLQHMQQQKRSQEETEGKP